MGMAGGDFSFGQFPWNAAFEKLDYVDLRQLRKEVMLSFMILTPADGDREEQVARHRMPIPCNRRVREDWCHCKWNCWPGDFTQTG